VVIPRRIDVHFHIIPEFYQDGVKAAGLGPARRAGYPPYSTDLGVELMDANGIQQAITSVAPPGVEFLDSAPARELARKLNDHASELGAKYPGRYGAFSTIPMKGIEDAVAEIEHGLGTLKHQGVCLFTSYGGRFLGDPHFDPVMDALNRRGAVCFVHPALSTKTLALNLPAFVVEYPFETTRAAVNLLFSGTLERYPSIKFILAHAGGALPYFAWRLGATPQIDPTLPQWPPEKFDSALSHFWYENALSCGSATMGALKAVADPNKLLFGSDWPYVQAPLVAAEVATHEKAGLHSDAERAAIDRGNALKLFLRPPLGS
jgi:predicted TIM-barrel fold metal-dependent hydrolase